MTLERSSGRAVWLALLVFVAGTRSAEGQGGCPTITPSPNWAGSVAFEDDPFVGSSTFSEPRWIKFLVQSCDPSTVYFQDSDLYAFHYDFATAEFDPFVGLSLEDFNQKTLFETGREALLGAIVLPPLDPFSGAPPVAEFGIQLISEDPLDPAEVVQRFQTVAGAVQADPGVQSYYFPTFEQLESAQANEAFFAANGIELSSPARWSTGDSCYARGWGMGRLRFVPATDIDAAFEAGILAPDDILLTDGVPADVPLVAGILTTAPATPNSHVAILASTFQVPFAFLGTPDRVQRAFELIDRQVLVRVDQANLFSGSCRVDLFDAEPLGERAQGGLFELKVPDPIDFAPVAPFGGLYVNTDGLTPQDVDHFGGKASNFGFLRRAIPANSPVAAALSFDLWNDFMDQVMPGGLTLRQEIDQILSQYSYPPADMQAFLADLDVIEDRIEDDTVFTPAQEAAIFAFLADPQFGFDPTAPIRFRSSANVEDGEFTGAGLYDSVSGCILDELDGDDLGPSLCDPTKSSERGVFRAIRRVFSGFYLQNAVLERLRHGVDESQVGMAILVHHNFPDALELANGVAVVTRSAFSTSIELVTQLGAVSVTNPELGSIPEVVDVFFSPPSSFFPSLTAQSNLVQLGDTVMDFPADYVELSGYLLEVSERYATETGKTNFVLDLEYKKMSGGAVLPSGGLVVKQVRELPQPDPTPDTIPFLIHDEVEFRVLQGGGGSALANHRLKSRWSLRARDMFLSPANLTKRSVLREVDVTFHDGCRSNRLVGKIQSFDSFTHAYPGGFTRDSFRLPDVPNPRDLSLTVSGVDLLVADSQVPVRTLHDMGFIGGFALSADYDQAVPAINFIGDPPVPTTRDLVFLIPEYEDTSGDQLHTRVMPLPGGVTIVSTFYLHPPDTGICAGCIFGLSSWVETTITGLTSQPIRLVDDWSQSYNAGQHNFSEEFVFEPRLSPGFTPTQAAELEAQGIDLIYVSGLFQSNWAVQYLDLQDCAPFDPPTTLPFDPTVERGTAR